MAMKRLLKFLSTEGVPAALSTILEESLPEGVRKDARIGTMMELCRSCAGAGGGASGGWRVSRQYHFRQRLRSSYGTETDMERIITPISVLPIDIIQEVILHASESSQLTVPTDTRTAPWTYGQVCSLWRTATLSLPPVWSNISVYLCWCEAEHIKPFNEILSRSKQSPLNITFQCDTTSNEQYLEDSSSEIVEALVSQCDRWKELSFIGPFPTSFTEYLTNNLKPPPLLTSIATHNPEFPVIDRLQLVSGTFLVPVLQTISKSQVLHKVEIHPHSVRIDEWRKLEPNPLPWHQITHLKFDAGRAEGPMEYWFLRLMPNLVQYNDSLTYYPKVIKPMSSESYELLRHHKLTHLELREQPWPWLDRVVFPSLQHLSWRVWDRMESKDSGKGVDAVSSLLARSECRLQSLHLIDFHCAALPILDAVPSLQYFRVSRSKFSKLLVECLIDVELTSGKLPELKELAFEDMTMFSPSARGENIFHTIIPMLEARRNTNPEYFFLKKFSLLATTSAEHFADEDQSEKLNELHDGGLDLNISVCTRDLSALDFDSFFEVEEEERMNKKILAGTHEEIFVFGRSSTGTSEWQNSVRRKEEWKRNGGSQCDGGSQCHCTGDEGSSDSNWSDSEGQDTSESWSDSDSDSDSDEEDSRAMSSVD